MDVGDDNVNEVDIVVLLSLLLQGTGDATSRKAAAALRVSQARACLCINPHKFCLVQASVNKPRP